MGSAVNQRPTVTTSHILQGAGKLKVDGIEMGSFSGGVKVNKSQSEIFVESDYAIGAIDSEVKSVDLQVSTDLEEATLTSLAMAWGLHSSSVTSAAVSSSKLLNLKPEKTMLEHIVVFEGMSAEDRQQPRVFTLNKCVVIGSSNSTLMRGTKTVVPVTFKALLDANGTFGTIKDGTSGEPIT